MAELLKNEYFVWGVMALLVLGLTQVLKLPIKALTKKIADPKAKTRVNAVIMLLPIILGLVLDFLYCSWQKVPFLPIEGVQFGTSAIMFYGLLEKFFKGEQSAQTTKLLQLATEISKDGKVDKSDAEIVKDFVNKVH